MKYFRQFTLRTLLVGMLLVGVWLGWKRHSTETQRLAAEFILSKHGYVGYDYEYDADAYRHKNPVLPSNRTLIDVLGIDWFHSIVWVELMGPLSDEDIAKVTNLKSIRGLVVSGHEVPTNDEYGAKWVSPDITALSLERIGKLPQLQRLWVDVRNANATGMAGWRNLSKLEELNLSGCDDSHLGHAARIPNLKNVELWSKVTDHVGAKFSEDALLQFSKSSKLEVIKVMPSIPLKTINQLKLAHPNLKVSY